MNFNIQKLTTEIAKGEELPFCQFYDLYKSRMHSYIFVLTKGDKHLTDEVFQDSMLRVVRYMKPFEQEEILWNWLVRIMKSSFIDQIRKIDRKITTEYQIDEISAEVDPAQNIEFQQQDLLHFHLLQAVNSLPNDEKILIEAHYFNRESQKKLAKTAQLSEKALGMRFSRIRKKIKSFIEEYLKNG